MCFSKNVSLFTFLTGIIGGLLCYQINTPDYKIIGLFFMFVSLMQGIEYLLWSHQTCDKYNKLISNLGMILNHLQPVILCILLFIYSKEKFNKNKKLILTLITVYIVFIIPYSLKFKNQCTMKDTNNHLDWKWNHMDNGIIVYFLFLLCLVVFGYILGKSFSLFALLSYSISYFIYSQEHITGSIWCMFSAFGPLLYFLFYTLTKTKVL